MVQRNKEATVQKEKPMVAVKQKMKTIGRRIQKLWAEWMSRRTAKMSRRTLYILLALFVCGGTVYNTMILTGLWKSENLNHGTIAIPNGAIRQRMVDSPIIIDQQIRSIRAARASFDSLKKTREGRAMLDSIARRRPGLLDSLRKAEDILTKF